MTTRTRSAGTRTKLALAALGAAGVGILLFAVLVQGSAPTGPAWTGSVAVVDGAPISRELFDEYLAVFTDPEGHTTVAREAVLQSLINQALVHQEAERRHVVISNAELAAAADTAARLVPRGAGTSFERAGGMEGLRRRLHAFLEFRAVQLAVLPADLTASLQDDELHDDAQDAAGGAREGPTAGSVFPAAVSSPALDRAWRAWLREVARCATITIIDETSTIPSSTPGPGCEDTP